MWDLKTIIKQNKQGFKAVNVTVLRTATITIGRNISARPMTAGTWQTFRRSIINACHAYGEETFVESSGKGKYKGIQEDNFTVVFSIDTLQISTLKSCLSGFCRYFSQECIALTIGETDLIK